MVAHPSTRLWPSFRRVGASRYGLVAACVLAAASCEKMPLVAPSGTAMTLVASTNVLPVDGSADITAILIEGGTSSGTNATTTAGTGTPVHNGTLVTFTTSLGKIEPVDARTEAGRATVKLIGDGRSGVATITAFSGAATKTLTVNIGAAGATRVVVTANPQSLPGTGGTTTITAHVEDAQGNGLQGVPVAFTTTKGTLSATTVISNTQGFSTTELTTTQEATVSAIAGSVSPATVAITLRPRTTITLTPPTSAVVSVPAAFTVAPATTGTGTSFITDVVVNFGDGTTPTTLGTVAGTQSVQHLFRVEGQLTVKATGKDSEGLAVETTTTVVVSPLTFTYSSPAAFLNTNVTFTITPSSTLALIDRYEWDFGDGNSQTTSGNQSTHQYGATGQRIVTVRIVTVAGKVYTVVIPVTVQ